MKSYVEGLRAFNYFTALCMDRVSVSERDEERTKWRGLVELLTPICKAFSSDRAMDICSTAIDVLGGYGYCVEFPIEQYLRDTKIACIYEGTNGMQAFDLVWRKLDQNTGKNITNLFEAIGATIKDLKKIEELKLFRAYLEEAYNAASALTRQLRDWNNGPEYIIPVLYARPYLTILGELIVGWLLMEAAGISVQKLNNLYLTAGAEGSESKQNELAKENPEASFYQGKTAVAKFFAVSILTTIKARCRSVMFGDLTAIAMNEESF